MHNACHRMFMRLDVSLNVFVYISLGEYRVVDLCVFVYVLVDMAFPLCVFRLLEWRFAKAGM